MSRVNKVSSFSIEKHFLLGGEVSDLEQRDHPGANTANRMRGKEMIRIHPGKLQTLHFPAKRGFPGALRPCRDGAFL